MIDDLAEDPSAVMPWDAMEPIEEPDNDEALRIIRQFIDSCLPVKKRHLPQLLNAAFVGVHHQGAASGVDGP